MKANVIGSYNKIIASYIKEIKDYNPLSVDEEYTLFCRYNETKNPTVKNKIIKHNLKFVVAIAKEYQNQGLSLPDLINEGNKGLIKAIDKYDITSGFKFISYAVWWIRQSILHGLNEFSRTVRLPTSTLSKIKMNEDFLDDYEKNNGVAPPIGETFIKNDEKMVYEGLKSIEISSVNRKVNDEGDEMTEFLNANDDSYRNFENKDYLLTLASNLEECMDILTNREKEIIKLYFGFYEEYKNLTLEDIGEKFSLTKERVRQIKESAMKKLRFNSDVIELSNF